MRSKFPDEPVKYKVIPKRRVFLDLQGKVKELPVEDLDDEKWEMADEDADEGVSLGQKLCLYR